MIKKQTNQNSLIAEQFSEIVKELSSLNKKEFDERIKMLTKGESVSHLFHKFNPKSNNRFLFNSAKSKLYLDLVKDLSNFNNSKLIDSVTKPKIGILLDKNSGNLSTISTRIKSFNSPSFLLFNYSDDASDLYKFFELLSSSQEIKVDNSSTLYCCQKIFFNLRMKIENSKSEKIKIKLIKALKKYCERELKNLTYLASDFLWSNYLNQDLFDFNQEGDSFPYIIDSLAFISKELNNLDQSKLSFFDKVWLKKERDRINNFGYLSKKIYTPFPLIVSGIGCFLEK